MSSLGNMLNVPQQRAAPPPARPMPQVPAAIETQQATVNELEKTVDDLLGRLSPVCAYVPTIAGESAGNNKIELVGVACAIHEQTRRIESSVIKLREILSALQV